MRTRDAGGGDDRDRELLGELRRLVTDIDPVPPEVTAFAKAALGWRRLDAELAELLSDSALEPDVLATVRAGLARARSVTFEASGLTIELEIETAGATFVVIGQLAPAGTAAVDVQRDDGTLAASTRSDELGRFRAELAPGGRVRLRIVGAGEGWSGAFETSWLTL
jgi:hypothetical protein